MHDDRPIPARPVIDEYFGRLIPDPYRYLENLDDSKVAAILKAEADRTAAIMELIPGRTALLNRITELGIQSNFPINYLKLRGNLIFYIKSIADSDHCYLYVFDNSTEVENLIVTTESFATEDQPVAISYFEPSWDGHYVVVGFAARGTEQSVIHIYETGTGKELEDKISRARFGWVSWLPDNHSFVYNHLQETGPNDPATDKQQKSVTRLHVLGTDPQTDLPVFGYGVVPEIDPTRLPIVIINDPKSERVLGAVVSGLGDPGEFYIADLLRLGTPDIGWMKIANTSDGITWAGLYGNSLFLISKRGSPRFQLLRTSATHPDLTSASVIATNDAVICGADSAGTVNSNFASDAFYLQLLKAGDTQFLRIPYDESRVPELVRLPFPGTSHDSATDPSRPGLFFNLTSWTRRGDYYYFDPVLKRTMPIKISWDKFEDPDYLEVAEVLVTARDGAQIPLSIVYKKGLKLDGSNPTFLEGYGAYGVPLMPAFIGEYLAWLERNGIWATAHVRGGGENGDDWHLAGQKGTKHNTWRDAIDCGEYLIRRGYTSSDKLAIVGTSAGGILVGRAITERPDLFCAAVNNVPMSDMLRNEVTANGVINIAEFGTIKTETGFQSLLAMSPYHHIEDGKAYPAVLLTTGINDARVDSWQPLKLAARLQSATTSGKPILLRVDYDAGHGVRSTQKQRFAALADQFSFLLWQCGDPDFQPLSFEMVS
jgi:prolyl oligopeptidase